MEDFSAAHASAASEGQTTHNESDIVDHRDKRCGNWAKFVTYRIFQNFLDYKNPEKITKREVLKQIFDEELKFAVSFSLKSFLHSK